MLISLFYLINSLFTHAECFERFYTKEHLEKFEKQELRTVQLSTRSEYNDSLGKSIQFADININLIRDGKILVLQGSAECNNDLYTVLEAGSNDPLTCKLVKNGQGSFTLKKASNDFKAVLEITEGTNFKNLSLDSTNTKSATLVKNDLKILINQQEALFYDSCEEALFKAHTVSPPRFWHEMLLHSIRHDLARPTVTARNLYHFSATLWDIYSTFDKKLNSIFINKTKVALTDKNKLEESRNEALAYGAYTFIKDRFKNAPGNKADSKPEGDGDSGDGKPDLLIDIAIDRAMKKYNYLIPDGNTKLSPSAKVGIDVANQIIEMHKNDGSRESENYSPDPNFKLKNVNLIMDITQSGINTPIEYKDIFDDKNEYLDTVKIPGKEFSAEVDINHWIPLYVPDAQDQNGNAANSNQTPLTLFWGKLPTFSDLSKFKSSKYEGVYFDDNLKVPTFEENFDDFVLSNIEVVKYSSYLNPINLVKAEKDFDRDGKYDSNPGADIIDISPASKGNNVLGTNDGKGYSINPFTQKPYQKNMVKRADYLRALAEFWADGPTSETPPGHWNGIANYVIDRMSELNIPYKWAGTGAIVPRTQFELMTYLTLNGALNDAAIVAWGQKGHHQGSRPIIVIRKLAKMAEKDDQLAKKLESLSPYFRMMEFDKKNVDTEGNILSIEKVKKLMIWSWRGPYYFGEADDGMDKSYHQSSELRKSEHEFYADLGVSGVGWIPAENWITFQKSNFVTPPFPGFISGHSTFSRAAAEVLAYATGTKYFPGGVGKYKAEKLNFESEFSPFNFEWATYFDASDESGISRIYGGIHASFDDLPARKTGSTIGKEATLRAQKIFESSIKN